MGHGLNKYLIVTFLVLFILYALLVSRARTATEPVGQYELLMQTINQTGGSGSVPAPTVNATVVPGTGTVVAVPTTTTGTVVADLSADHSPQVVIGTESTGSSSPSCPSSFTAPVDTSDIRNPQYPTCANVNRSIEQNTIDQQRKLIREYQSYIKNLRGQCCRRVWSGTNLLNNSLSNKNYEVRPMIANGTGNEMYLQTDDFSNIMTISPQDAERYRVSFYDGEISPMRYNALQADPYYPLYSRGFSRNFVSRIPGDIAPSPFKVVPWMDYPGDDSTCPSSRACQGTANPPFSTLANYTCAGIDFPPATRPPPYDPSKNEAPTV